jgi:hypothetical protein
MIGCPNCSKELDLSALKLVPAETVATVRADLTAKLNAAQAEAKTATEAKAALEKTAASLSTRLAMSAGAPDEKRARIAEAAHRAAMEGEEKPVPFADWLKTEEGRMFLPAPPPQAAPAPAAPAPAASAPAPAGAPQPAPAPAPPPNTATGTIPGGPPRLDHAAFTAEQDRLTAAYSRARTAEERTTIGKQLNQLATDFQAASAPRT